MSKKIFDNKTVLIPGGTGSWGKELTKQLLKDFKPREIRIYSRNELRQVEMKRDFNDPRLKFIIGDVRDLNRFTEVTQGVDYIFHLAAIKHVTVCEENPWEAVLTNIYGTKNMIDAAITNEVSRAVFVSTDKAVDPLNFYGATKACAEKIVIAANNLTDKTSFVCVRGGNALGSTGSVVPLFRKQISELNKVTLTDPRMTRFMLSLPEAIQLIFKATESAVGGEVFVMKMPGLTIPDLIDVMVKELGNKKTKIEAIGIRPGEKIDEVLVSRYEADRVISLKDYFIILPMIEISQIERHYKGVKKVEMGEFNSRQTRRLTKREIKKMLKDNGFLERGLIPADKLIASLSRKQLEKIAKKEKWVI